MTAIIEMAKIKLLAGKTEADLLEASSAFQQGFLDGLPGFVRRELLKAGEGEYIDLVHWRSKADADAVMQQAATSPACMAYFSVMDMNGLNPDEGVSHYVSLATYG